MPRLLPLFALTLLYGSALSLGGCIVVHDNTTHPVTCDLPAFDNANTPYLEYHVSANDTTTVPVGDAAYIITSNGVGSYRLSWTDTTGAATCFNGLITAIGPSELSGAAGVSGHEAVERRRADQQIAFASIPGATYDGVIFAAAHDPVYLDLYRNGVGSVVYFVDGVSRLATSSATNIAAIKSP